MNVTEEDIETTECFTFHGNDGTVLNILTGDLRNGLMTLAPTAVGDILFPDETMADIIKNHGIELPRLESMTEEEAKEPVIVLETDGGTKHILADGAHRRAYWAQRGINTMRGWVVPEYLWEMFLFDPNDPGVLHMTEEGSLLPQRRNADYTETQNNSQETKP